MNFKKLTDSLYFSKNINIEYEEFTENSKNTTPDPILLNHHLSEMVKRNIKVCFVEVSSHGIKQKRVFGKDFKGIVFLKVLDCKRGIALP